ncbi:hypothetical protein N7523_004866 [Penicillium sp. IBT 18751x]|nr:hypothetical protein N7523_004866 [Penicillium sp. IBT 18751x]
MILVAAGAFVLYVRSHNFNHVLHPRLGGCLEAMRPPMCSSLGAGNNWGSLYTVAHRVDRTVVGGEDATVVIGELIYQNGGHGLFFSHHGLAFDQVLQVTVITTDGPRLVATMNRTKTSSGQSWS